MKVLIACEFSGIVRSEFEKRGHFAVSCDLIPSEKSGNHYRGDVRDLLNKEWDLMIAHPPCTYLANSGVPWLKNNEDRWTNMREAAHFFNVLLRANIPKICIENPIQHKYARELIDISYNQIIHPYMFGEMQQKATCLWLKGLPNLVETNNVKQEMMKLPIRERQRLHYLPPSEVRGQERSRTFVGIAKAMAEQWG